jgi:hypothetical protein
VPVSACDRPHNLTAIGEDLDDPAVGTDVFTRFNAQLDDILRRSREQVRHRCRTSPRLPHAPTVEPTGPR